jgi:hypothetical protein
LNTVREPNDFSIASQVSRTAMFYLVDPRAGSERIVTPREISRRPIGQTYRDIIPPYQETHR